MPFYDLICEKCGTQFRAKGVTYEQIQNEGRPCYCSRCYSIYQNKNSLVEMKCEQCGSTFMISKSKLADWKFKGISSLCNACRKKKRAEVNRANWERMSPEEQEEFRRKRAEDSRKRIMSLSPEEFQKNTEQLQEGSKRKREELAKLSSEERKAYYEAIGMSPAAWSQESKESQRKKLSEYRKQYLASLSLEEKEAYREQRREWYRNLSDEEKAAVVAPMLEGQQQWRENLSEEEKAKISHRSSDTAKRTWANKTPEERAAQAEAMSRGSIEFHQNLTQEQKAERQRAMEEGLRRWFDSLSDEERKLRQKAKMEVNRRIWEGKTPEEKVSWVEGMNQGSREFWENLSEEERQERLNNWNEGYRNWFDNLTEEDRTKRAEMLSKIGLEMWDNMSLEERAALREKQKASQPSSTNNSLHQRFIQAFNHSILANEFLFVPEWVSMFNTAHRWDYAIFHDTELVALVDLDGSYYHGDECDYDGIHSKEEYDEERSQSIPDGVKFFIIQELNFAKSFEQLIKGLHKNYDEFLEGIFRECRHRPFPSPYYRDIELVRSYRKLVQMSCDDEYHKKLSLNTRLGDRLIQHFHESIWSAHVKGKPSPHEAWYNDDLLKKVIKNRTIYQTTVNPNKILQGFNVSKVAPKVSVFSAGRAKMIIHRYLDDFDTIFDPFSGFSGRMLGAISLGKDYLGQDLSIMHVNESNKMISFLQEYGYPVNAEVYQANVLDSYGTYPCLFTCPPYGDKEQWLEVPVDRRTCDDWIDICLDHFKCHRYVFVVDHTDKYKDYIMDEIDNRSHFNRVKEYVVVIDR